MNIELIWLAYDHEQVRRAWSVLTIRELYFAILQDDFRRKVNPQIMLFHKSQNYLVHNLEQMMKYGAIDVTLDEYKAYLFKHDIEDFPSVDDELFFDFQLICFFSTMRMADDYAVVERIFTMFLQRIGFLSEDELWNTQVLPTPDHYFELITSISRDSTTEVAQFFNQQDPNFLAMTERFVRNALEFFNFSRSNGFKTFYYNNYMNIRYWGDLVQRKNERNARVVKVAFKPIKERRQRPVLSRRHLPELQGREKFRRKQMLGSLVNALLNENDILIKQKSMETLGLLGDPSALPALIEILRVDAPELRQEAALAIGELGSEEATEALLEALKDESVSVSTAAGLALGMIGAEGAFTSLLRAVLQGNHQLASIVAFYPGKPSSSGQDEMRCLLQELLATANPTLRDQGVFILGQLGRRGDVRTLASMLANEGDPVLKDHLYASLQRLSARCRIKEPLEPGDHLMSKAVFLGRRAKQDPPRTEMIV